MSREAYKALAFLFQYLVFRVLDQRKGEISNQASCCLISQSGYKTTNYASLILKGTFFNKESIVHYVI